MDRFIVSLAYKYNGWGLALYILAVSLIAGLLAGIIGIERETKGQAAGLRTHVLLSVGCTLLMVISVFGIGIASGQIDLSSGSLDNGLLSYDTSRIAAGIIAGIGFVCAGTIIRTGVSVKGLTTAATLWVCAGIGMACGCGLVLEAIAAAAVTMMFLVGLFYIEKVLGKSSPRVTITVKKSVTMVRDIRQQADANGLVIKNIGTHMQKLENGEEALSIDVLFALQSGQAVLEEFCESFLNREGVISVEKHHFKHPVGE